MAIAAPLNPNPATSNQQLVCAIGGVPRVPTALYGFNFAESTGSASAKIRLHDGTGISGNELAIVTLGANESVRDWFADESVAIVKGGIYVEVVAGSIEGVVYWA